MLHLALYGLLAIIVAGGLFLVASRFLPAGEQIAPALRDEPPWALPAERRLAAEDVDTLRLPVALRGYRFAETDILLDRLAGELRARDFEIAQLRGQGTGTAPDGSEAHGSEPDGSEPDGSEPAAPLDQPQLPLVSTDEDEPYRPVLSKPATAEPASWAPPDGRASLESAPPAPDVDGR